jgi:hypothetical protein
MDQKIIRPRLDSPHSRRTTTAPATPTTPPTDATKSGTERRQERHVTSVGGLLIDFPARTTSLRQILAELDQDHDGRADCDYHRADKRQLFQQADKDRSDSESSLKRQPATPIGNLRSAPSRSGLIFNAKRGPAMANLGVP